MQPSPPPLLPSPPPDPELLSILQSRERNVLQVSEKQPITSSINPTNLLKDETTQKIETLIENFTKNSLQNIKNQAEDRNQVEETIKKISHRIQEMQDTETYQGMGVMYETLVKALQVKSDINANGSRNLDSIAKLLSAMKNNNLVIIENERNEDKDLEAILKRAD